jgi:hypothetical protein
LRGAYLQGKFCRCYPPTSIFLWQAACPSIGSSQCPCISSPEYPSISSSQCPSIGYPQCPSISYSQCPSISSSQSSSIYKLLSNHLLDRLYLAVDRLFLCSEVPTGKYYMLFSYQTGYIMSHYVFVFVFLKICIIIQWYVRSVFWKKWLSVLFITWLCRSAVRNEIHILTNCIQLSDRVYNVTLYIPCLIAE